MSNTDVTKFIVGDKVQAVTDPTKAGTIEALAGRQAGTQYYEVFWGGHEGYSNVPEDFLLPYRRSGKPIENLLAGHIGGYHDFVRVITHCRLNRQEPLRDHYFAFNASRTKFYPYQFKPLLKFLDSPIRRILIADEVGLGKTIEAGLILTELEARETIHRVLVVCPASLREKWKLELRKRFGQEFRVLQQREFNEFLNEYEDSPDATRLKGIVSYESIRGRRILDRLTDLLPDFQLVIMDEAHHMRNPGRLTHRVGKLLADCTSPSGALVFLTATPLQLSNDNLHALLNILDEARFPDKSTSLQQIKNNRPIVNVQRYMSQIAPPFDQVVKELHLAALSPWLMGNPLLTKVQEQINQLRDRTLTSEVRRTIVVGVHRDLAALNLLGHIYTRTRKRDAHTNHAKRKSFSIEVHFTEMEMRFYDAVSEFVREEAERGNNNSVIVQWMVNMPQRRMTSCIPAMVTHYRQQLVQKSAPFGTDDEEYQEDLGWIEVESDTPIGTPRVADASQRLSQLLSLWQVGAPDTKYEKLLEILQGLREEEGGRCKVVIFSFFKATLRYLSRQLASAGLQSVSIHGDVPADERPGIIEQFRASPDCEVLLSSRVGSEGLDFQFCHSMVNYDLPWNPMEVEQRIGRLDRIGQESEVIKIYSLWIANTIESRILRKLYDRVKIFEESVGDLEIILGETVARLGKELFASRLTREEESERVERALLAIEKERQELSSLEENATKLLGTDDFFKDEVDNIIKKKRYMTPIQLRLFFEDFIRQFCPRTVLREVRNANHVFSVVPDEELEKLIRRQRRSLELPAFVHNNSKDGIVITFDSDVAYNNPRIEFLNAVHPIMRVAVAVFDEDKSKLLNASRVHLRSDKLAPGIYLYVIYRVFLNAAKGSTQLELIVCDGDGVDRCSPQLGEELLGEILELGDECQHLLNVNVAADLSAAIEAANRSIQLRIHRLKEDASVQNDNMLERQISSLRESYNRKIESLEKTIRNEELALGRERYLTLQRGKVNKIKAELDQRADELQRKKFVNVEFSELAAGVLEVVAP